MTEEAYDVVDLDELSLVELRTLARINGIKASKKVSRDRLVRAIVARAGRAPLEHNVHAYDPAILTAAQRAQVTRGVQNAARHRQQRDAAEMADVDAERPPQPGELGAPPTAPQVGRVWVEK